MPLIPLGRLHADPRNANVCTPDTLTKIRRNIERCGLYPALIVRPHPRKKDQFMILDGHHRKQVLESLGYTEIDCQIWNIDPAGAQLALATLNRLRGEDEPRKRAELIQSLTQVFTLPELTTLVPETGSEIEDLLALLSLEWDTLEAKVLQQIEHEQDSLPIPFTCMIAKTDYRYVEKTFQALAGPDQGAKLVTLCKAFLKEASDYDPT